MKNYKKIITLNKNSRGCYILDTIKGCSMCSREKPNGCYDNCYANNIAIRYRYEFSMPVKRDFNRDEEQLYFFGAHDEKHESQLINKIKGIEMPFVRIGEMGDPSFDWRHTIDICNIIAISKKPIVIITKHLNSIPHEILKEIDHLNICINTSISALDEEQQIKQRLQQYLILKNHCKSVLRIVSCDFNKGCSIGNNNSKIQDDLFNNENVIDTIFRPNENNFLVMNRIINVKKLKFLKAPVLASIFDEKTYFGDCSHCPDMCGVNL